MTLNNLLRDSDREPVNHEMSAKSNKRSCHAKICMPAFQITFPPKVRPQQNSHQQHDESDDPIVDKTGQKRPPKALLLLQTNSPYLREIKYIHHHRRDRLRRSDSKSLSFVTIFDQLWVAPGNLQLSLGNTSLYCPRGCGTEKPDKDSQIYVLANVNDESLFIFVAVIATLLLEPHRG